MILNHEDIIDILSILTNKLSNEFIITGSFADFFHIGFSDIKDIDIFITESHFFDCKNNFNINPKFNLIKSYIGIRKKIGSNLYKYLYKHYMIDITVIDPQIYGLRIENNQKIKLDQQDIVEILYNNCTYKVCSPLIRFHQLGSDNYSKKHHEYEEKIHKALMRKNKYQEIFGFY